MMYKWYLLAFLTYESLVRHPSSSLLLGIFSGCRQSENQLTTISTLVIVPSIYQ